MTPYGTDLRRIVARLEASEGRRIARRNARRDLETLCRKIRRELFKKFPTIGKDGELVIEAKLPIGQRNCTACGSYCPTAGKLAVHLVRKHGGKCYCGFVPGERRKAKDGTTFKGGLAGDQKGKLIGGLRGHLQRAGDLRIHATINIMGAMDKIPPETLKMKLVAHFNRKTTAVTKNKKGWVVQV